MSLTGSLQIGRSALAVSQAALQVAGHNMANAATVGFHRQSIHLAPMRGEVLGRQSSAGSGVQLMAIRREVDAALQARYRNALSQQSSDLVDQRFLTAIESLQNELTGSDISSALSVFFNSFSELANNPDDHAVRNVVVQQGTSLAGKISSLRRDYAATLAEADRALDGAATQVNSLLDRIAELNHQITHTEGATGSAGGQANALRDQRDQLISELSQFVDVNTVEQPNGSIDILIGSTPVVLGTVNRGLELRRTSTTSGLDISVRVRADGTHLLIQSGSIGGLLRQRNTTVQPAIDQLDAFGKQLIFQVNRIHSQGQGRAPAAGASAFLGSYSVQDAAANLNSTASGLPFKIKNGSFQIHLTHMETGTRTTHQIQVDGNSMSLNDLVQQIQSTVNGNVTAAVGANGQLQISAATGYQISFSDDSAGALAALGINTFFVGAGAADIGVNQFILDDPNRLAAGQGHIDGSNSTAMAIANLQEQRLDDLNGKTLREMWQNSVNGLAVKASAANAAAESSGIVKDSIYAQLQAVSGVSVDEEAINLLTFQRQFQAAARFISVIDETFQTLLSIA